MKIELTGDEVNLLGRALGELPLKDSLPLFQKLQQAWNEQQKPVDEPVHVQEQPAP